MLVSLIYVILSTCPGIVLSFVPPQRFGLQTLQRQSLTRASAVTTTRGYATTSSIETVFINRDIPELLDLDPNTQATVDAKTPLIFLPGLDGIEGYQSKSIDSLNEVFDVWRMTVSDDDRSSFMDIASVILEKLETFDKPAVIVGESFGGLLAAYIALRAKRSSISKLVMINPATSFDRTSWPLIAPIIASSGIASPIIQIATILSDAAQIQRAGRKIISGITSTQTAIDAYNGLLESSRTFTQNLSPETINWRISKWFDVGSSLMSEKYSKITTPTLILVGKNDRLLPSQAEGRRLRKEMTSSERVDVKEFDVGHTLLGDSFIDIASELKQVAGSKNAMDCAFPTAEDMVDVEKNFGPFLNSMSPIFLTRGSDGELKRGIDSLPTGINGRPVLLVGNHQLYGADCAQIIREFINTKSTLVRGLAHPMVFNDRDSNPLMAPTLKKYGAVEVSPTAIFELLKRNETVMLFPGGAREALHGKGEEYKLFWPEKTDFVRMAGMFDAIIIPFSSVGIAESVNIFFDKEDLEKIPFFGERIIKASTSLPNARAGDVESIMPPLLVPLAPERNYFLFGEPFDTRDLNIYDKKQCKVLYKNVKDSVEEGLQTLFKFRDADPYKKYVPRTIYEATAGGKQAPTAPLNMK